VVQLVVAAFAALVLLWIGFAMLRRLATPPPGPPPAGEMRRVNIRYRCGICGTELRLTLAADEDPPPPRHCMEDMTVVAPVDD
jgi:hypothetical protein